MLGPLPYTVTRHALLAVIVADQPRDGGELRLDVRIDRRDVHHWLVTFRRGEFGDDPELRPVAQGFARAVLDLFRAGLLERVTIADDRCVRVRPTTRGRAQLETWRERRETEQRRRSTHRPDPTAKNSRYRLPLDEAIDRIYRDYGPALRALGRV